MQSLGATALVIGAGGLGLPIVRSLRLPYPALVDAERRVYTDWGLLRAVYLVQKSGTFVVDTDGVIVHATSSWVPSQSMDLDAVIATLGELQALRPVQTAASRH